jgi:hypothetical protein
MNPWGQRPIEIRNLFNPAFCGLVLFHALKAYDDEDPTGMPFSLSLLILPLCLHKDSREILACGNRGYFMKIVSSHPQLLVNFGRRAADMLPFTFEALGLLMQLGVLQTTASGKLKSAPRGRDDPDPDPERSAGVAGDRPHRHAQGLRWPGAAGAGEAAA